MRVQSRVQLPTKVPNYAFSTTKTLTNFQTRSIAHHRRNGFVHRVENMHAPRRSLVHQMGNRIDVLPLHQCGSCVQS